MSFVFHCFLRLHEQIHSSRSYPGGHRGGRAGPAPLARPKPGSSDCARPNHHLGLRLVKYGRAHSSLRGHGMHAYAGSCVHPISAQASIEGPGHTTLCGVVPSSASTRVWGEFWRVSGDTRVASQQDAPPEARPRGRAVAGRRPPPGLMQASIYPSQVHPRCMPAHWPQPCALPSPQGSRARAKGRRKHQRIVP